MEYIKNTETGEIFEANPHLLNYAATQSHMILVDEKGRKLDTDDEPSDVNEALQAENEQLKQEIYDLKTELELYRQRDREGVEVDSPGETEAHQEPAEANRMEALLEAIGGLETGNPDHFVQSGKRAGKPRVEVLEAFAGIIEVSAAEADEAWKRFNAG